MKAWAEFTRVQKVVSTCAAFMGSTAFIIAALYGGYAHFATRAYADAGDKKTITELHTYQEQQVISSNRAEIWRAKREINRLNDEIASPGITPVRKARLKVSIKEYSDLIDCIQEAKDLCY